MADKAYSAAANRAWLRRHHITAVIPVKEDQKKHRRDRGRAGSDWTRAPTAVLFSADRPFPMSASRPTLPQSSPWRRPVPAPEPATVRARRGISGTAPRCYRSALRDMRFR